MIDMIFFGASCIACYIFGAYAAFRSMSKQGIKMKWILNEDDESPAIIDIVTGQVVMTRRAYKYMIREVSANIIKDTTEKKEEAKKND